MEKDNQDVEKRKIMEDYSSFAKLDRKGKRSFERNATTQLNIDSTASTIGDYNQERVRELMNDYNSPDSQASLQEIAEILYIKSNHFQRLVHYFSDMPMFAYNLFPNKGIREAYPTSVLADYDELAQFMKNLSVKQEFRKVLNEIFKVEVFYGYVHHTETDMYIQKLPIEICRISSVEDGSFNFSINMSLFADNIETYQYSMPDEIIDLYNEWMAEQERQSNSRSNSGSRTGRGRVEKQDEEPFGDWVEIPAQNTICIKYDEANPNIYVPPFAGTFDSIFEIDGYKASRRNKEQIDNYMLIYQKIPIRDTSNDNNDFLIDYGSALSFHQMLEDNAPTSVGVVTTPMELEPIEFAKDSVDVDNVAKSIQEFWGASGVSQLLFSTPNNSNQGMNASILTDEQVIFSILEQFERWVNRYIRYTYGDSLFTIKFLEVTKFNNEKFVKKIIEVGQYGGAVRNMITSAIGIEPIEARSMNYLENDILGLNKEWVPLQSSHTMSGNSDESERDADEGRPEKDPNEISDETQRKQDNDNSVEEDG